MQILSMLAYKKKVIGADVLLLYTYGSKFITNVSYFALQTM